MNNRKIPAPIEFRVSGPDSLGTIYWQDRRTEDSGVYKRTFSNEAQLFAFLEDMFGRRYEAKIRAHLEVFSNS